MKKIVLLGDSIRLIGYGRKVEEMLKAAGYDVWQPDDNCRFSAYTLRMFFDKHEEIAGADIIHFNCGAWDVCELYGDGPFTSLDAYVSNIVRIARVAQSCLKPGGKLIFATTTLPKPASPYYKEEVIVKYNEAAVKALKDEGVIIINDLFSLTKNENNKMICEDDIHLSEYGIETAAEQTYRCIIDAMN